MQLTVGSVGSSLAHALRGQQLCSPATRQQPGSSGAPQGSVLSLCRALPGGAGPVRMVLSNLSCPGVTTGVAVGELPFPISQLSPGAADH